MAYWTRLSESFWTATSTNCDPPYKKAERCPVKIALLYNLNRRSSAAELEFDLPETIDALHATLARYHEVRAIECTRDVAKWLQKLEDFGPDIAFSVAEGYFSAVREAFYSSLFEQLQIPFIGSDPTTMMFAQNKALSKTIASSVGVLTSKWRVVASYDDFTDVEQYLSYPVLVKPNSEGSSIGIDRHAVVSNGADLKRRVAYVWEHLGSIALVEEYIPHGMDLSVSYVQDLGPEIFGPVTYDTGGAEMYDYQWKSRSYLFPNIVVQPTGLSDEIKQYTRDAIRRMIQGLDIRGYARADFRVGLDGKCYFLEVNGQVEMAEKAEFAVPVIQAGHSYQELVLHIADTAVRNWKRLPSAAGTRLHFNT